MATADTPLLELRGVSKAFGAVQALYRVDFEVRRGEVMALVGDNGAGKSTLIKSVVGIYPFDEGEVRYEGKHVNIHGPRDAAKLGIEVVYQDLALCNNLTASANVFLAREKMRGFGPFRILDDRAMNERARELFDELKSETRPAEKVRMMSGGQRQAVAIARTHLSRAKIVLMDEPTAAISVRQVAEVLDLLRRLREQGMAVLLISHRMPDVFGVADRIVVLRRGHKVADKPIRESSPEEVTGLITGAIRAA